MMMDLSSFALKKTLVTRFALDVPLSMRAPRRCPCGQRIMLPTGHSPEELEVAAETERQWLRHRYTCPTASGLRIKVHDSVVRLWVALLKDAGFTEVEYEPRRWDAEAGSDEEKHRRPDVTAFNPLTMQRWVLDVSAAWAEVAAGAAAKLAARGRERHKHSAYDEAMGRVRSRDKRGVERAPEGWLEDKFVALGYEVGGAWGPEADYAFEEVLKVKAATIDKERYDFTVVNFAKHWREAIGVAIARGAAAVVARPPPQEYGAGAGGEEEDGLAHDAASPEYSPDAR